MGIATDLSRVKSNITAALAAIAEKGVTVPDGSNSDALAELIASIEVVGSSSTGTMVPVENYGTGYTFHHALNKIPTAFVIYRESDLENGTSAPSGFVCAYCTKEGGRFIRNSISTPSSSLNTFASTSYFLGSETLQCTNEDIIWNIASTVTEFIAGQVYRWFAS